MRFLDSKIITAQRKAKTVVVAAGSLNEVVRCYAIGIEAAWIQAALQVQKEGRQG